MRDKIGYEYGNWQDKTDKQRKSVTICFEYDDLA